MLPLNPGMLRGLAREVDQPVGLLSSKALWLK
jgi:hypothetical protein